MAFAKFATSMLMAGACLLAFVAGNGYAASLPPASELPARIGFQPVPVTVREPHLPANDPNAVVDYLGYPIETILTLALGPDWPNKGSKIAFQALDGYVSRIPMKQLQSGKAFLVFARRDGAPFVVDNVHQNEQAVPLGPYYLVWDNLNDRKGPGRNASAWPYQVTDLAPFDEALRKAALTPPGLGWRYGEGATLTADNCLNCHTVNGYGGNKVSTDLTNLAKERSENDFVAWVLNPTSVRPGTTMPALSTSWPDAKRRAVAEAIYDYLKNVPGVE